MVHHVHVRVEVQLADYAALGLKKGVRAECTPVATKCVGLWWLYLR